MNIFASLDVDGEDGPPAPTSRSVVRTFVPETGPALTHLADLGAAAHDPAAVAQFRQDAAAVALSLVSLADGRIGLCLPAAVRLPLSSVPHRLLLAAQAERPAPAQDPMAPMLAAIEARLHALESVADPANLETRLAEIIARQVDPLAALLTVPTQVDLSGIESALRDVATILTQMQARSHAQHEEAQAAQTAVCTAIEHVADRTGQEAIAAALARLEAAPSLTPLLEAVPHLPSARSQEDVLAALTRLEAVPTAAGLDAVLQACSRLEAQPSTQAVIDALPQVADRKTQSDILSVLRDLATRREPESLEPLQGALARLEARPDYEAVLTAIERIEAAPGIQPVLTALADTEAAVRRQVDQGLQALAAASTHAESQQAALVTGPDMKVALTELETVLGRRIDTAVATVDLNIVQATVGAEFSAVRSALETICERLPETEAEGGVRDVTTLLRSSRNFWLAMEASLSRQSQLLEQMEAILGDGTDGSRRLLQGLETGFAEMRSALDARRPESDALVVRLDIADVLARRGQPE